MADISENTSGEPHPLALRRPVAFRLNILHLISNDHAISAGVSTLSAATLIALWYIGCFFLPHNLLPLPHVVVGLLWKDLSGAAAWRDIGVTLARIAVAFTIAMTSALVLGFWMALSKTAGRFFQVWIVTGITIPALVIILTLYMVAGLNDTAAVFGAAIPIIPILAINIREGVKGIDYRLIDMARAFRASRRQKLFEVIVPQIAPMLLASTRFGVGLVWKMVLFVELLGRGNGVGYKIEYYYSMFNMGEVLAHAMSFVLIMLFLEIVVLQTVEKHLFGWRQR